MIRNQYINTSARTKFGNHKNIIQHLVNFNKHCTRRISNTENNIQNGIPDFGELMQATFYTDQLNPTDWFLFEKYDGIRAFWDPSKKKFFSRFGKELKVVPEMIEKMPPIYLDGEFWFGRKHFKDAQKISNRVELTLIPWDKFRYVVFDYPSKGDLPYRERYKLLSQDLPENHDFVMLAPTQICKGRDHLMRYSKAIMEEGAEGIILRDPTIKYVQGKSKGYVKFKALRDDEARIIEQAGINRWKCELPNGVTFESDVDPSLTQEKEPKPYDIVSFRFTAYHIRRGTPISPLIYRYRTDVTWEDIQKGWKQPKTFAEFDIPRKEKTGKKQLAEKGYYGDSKNRRILLDNFAAHKGFDPINPDNWYKVTIYEISEFKGGSAVLRYYNNSLRRALLDLYPEVSFDVNRFTNQAAYWVDINNVKAFLEELAKERGFDPVNQESWYNTRIKDILIKKGGNGLLSRYNWSLPKILNTVYPDIKWDESRFAFTKRNRPHVSVRTYFEEFANIRKFDPLVADNWYHVTRSNLAIVSELKRLLIEVNDWTDRLISAFPEVTFDHSKFASKGYWNSKTNLVNFFNSFAFARQFDPRVAEHWYQVQTYDIVTFKKEGESLLSHFDGFLVNALRVTYQDIHFENKMFRSSVNDKSCRQFFDKLASDLGIDPLNSNSWSSISLKYILCRPGGRIILRHYGNLANALRSSYPSLHVQESKVLWSDTKLLRAFFNKVAEVMNFDPLQVENWYKISTRDIYAQKKGSALLRYYGGSFKEALVKAYPELNFDTTNFLKKRNFWSNIENCRKFFDDYAKGKGKEPTNTDLWHSLKKQDILGHKGGFSILRNFNGSLSDALQACYPELNFSKSAMLKPLQ